MKKKLSKQVNELQQTLAIIETYTGDVTNTTTRMDIAFLLCPYLNNLKKLIKIVDRNVIIETIAHDYLGLKNEDADFCPRLS
jgi:hypothetical protein